MLPATHWNGRVLAVLTQDEDRARLQNMFYGTGWELQTVRTVEQADRLLARDVVDVIICDHRLADGLGWEDILRIAEASQLAPPVIVASRSPDYDLWAEILRLGGYDVLQEPFDYQEVFHAIGHAWRHATGRLERQRAERSAAAAGAAGWSRA